MVGHCPECFHLVSAHEWSKEPGCVRSYCTCTWQPEEPKPKRIGDGDLVAGQRIRIHVTIEGEVLPYSPEVRIMTNDRQIFIPADHTTYEVIE